MDAASAGSEICGGDVEAAWDGLLGGDFFDGDAEKVHAAVDLFGGCVGDVVLGIADADGSGCISPSEWAEVFALLPAWAQPVPPGVVECVLARAEGAAGGALPLCRDSFTEDLKALAALAMGEDGEAAEELAVAAMGCMGGGGVGDGGMGLDDF